MIGIYVDLLEVGEHSVARSEHVKFRAVIIDEYLSWKPHLDAVCTNISRDVGVISRLRFILPKKVLVMLYNSIVLPYLTYWTYYLTYHGPHSQA